MADNITLLDILLQQNAITQNDYDTAMALAQSRNIEPVKALLELETQSDEKTYLRVIAEEIGEEYRDLYDIELDPNVVNLISYETSKQLGALLLYEAEGALFVAVPLAKLMRNLDLRADLKRLTKKPAIRMFAASKKDINTFRDRAYRADNALSKIAENVTQQEAVKVASGASNAVTSAMPDAVEEENEVINFVSLVLEQAVNDKASDIHFDPQEDGIHIRERLDGVLYDMAFAPRGIQAEVTSRVKVLADLDIAERRRPQDGRLTMDTPGGRMDMRVAIIPTVHGEKIVMRVLDNSSAQLPLTSLGFSESNLEKFRKIVHRPHGMLLVTGPTGSGKSTTLYSALHEINSREINIITAEEPVEYQIEGISQVPVNPKQGMTFEKALRSILRLDPDVILVGEVRDLETATIAMQAGLTGHMVYSTLHTNDAASALTRLGEMGIESYITTDVVAGIVSQRLIRRLCKKCKVGYTPSVVELEAVEFPHDPENPPTIYKAQEGGCKDCNGTGYRGRVAVHEVLIMSDDIKEAVIRGAKALEIGRMAVAEGMTTLKQDAFEKVNTGLTSIEEALRVVI